MISQLMRGFTVCGGLFFGAGALFGIPLAAQSSAGAALEREILRPGDIIRLRVWPDSALGGSFVVEESGAVQIPTLGDITVVGRTVTDIREQLTMAFKLTMSDPIVIVTPVFRLSVLGAVVRPGLYQASPTDELFDVISLAGGFRDNAEVESLRIIRDGGVIEIDAEEFLETGQAPVALRLRSGDRIVVPQRRAGIFSRGNLSFLLQAATLVTTIISINRR